MQEAKPEVRPTMSRRGLRNLAIFLLIVALVIVFMTGVLSITRVWNLILLQTILNLLVLLSKYLLGNFGLAIIVLTILIRLITLPITLRQLRSAMAMRSLQPKIRELQKKYAKDKQKLSLEMIKINREQGARSLGCLFPTLIQLPFWIALYQSVTQALAATNENLFGLSKNLYSSSLIQGELPLNHHFIALNLLRGNLIMAILVALSMWVFQKMSIQPSAEPEQESMNRIQLLIMPLLFGFMAISLPSGLSLFWVVSNIIGIVTQYTVAGWGTLKIPSLPFLNRGAPQAARNQPPKTEEAASTDSNTGDDVAVDQESASVGGPSPEKKGSVGRGTIPQRKKVRP
jgi:YidC/Oxa1 family membrane protein insertase